MKKTYFSIDSFDFTDDNHIDNNFFFVSNKIAGIIAKKQSYRQSLPALGMKLKVLTNDNKECWLQTTGIRYWKGKTIKRGYVWAINGPINN